MNTPIDYIRFAADQALYTPSLINLRPYTIQLETHVWSGKRQGLGNEIITNIDTLNGSTVGGIGQCPPRLRQVTSKEVSVSNGQLRDRDLKIGPFIQTYAIDGASGGYDPLFFEPPVISPTELYISVSGPDYPSQIRYKITSVKADTRVVFYIFIRATDAN